MSKPINMKLFLVWLSLQLGHVVYVNPLFHSSLDWLNIQLEILGGRKQTGSQPVVSTNLKQTDSLEAKSSASW